MPPKFAGLKPRVVISRFAEGRFFNTRAVGLARPPQAPGKPGRVTVPYHERFDLPKHIVKSIVRQAGLTNAEFFDLLDL